MADEKKEPVSAEAAEETAREQPPDKAPAAAESPEAPETSEKTPDRPGRKGKKAYKLTESYSVPLYVTIMFAVFVVLILLSYFISQRNASETITSLNEEHTRTQSQAQENIEALQNDNVTLSNQVSDDKEKIDALEQENADLKQQMSDQEEKAQTRLSDLQKQLNGNYSDLMKEYRALRALSLYAQALKDGDAVGAETYRQQVEELKDLLDEDMLAYYNSLSAAK